MNCSRPIHWPTLAALLLICLAGPAVAAEAPAPPRKVVTIEGITEYRLANGFRFLLFPDESSSTVTVNMTVLVGSRHEGYGETGMAHLLEHMLFKGTPTHRDIPKLLKERGAKFNANTSYDRTTYFEAMPATDANLEFGIKLEADRLLNSYVKREDLVSEMTVVRNEFEMYENSPDAILSQRMWAVAYEWHNYGKTTIGNRSDIERVPIDRLQAFYRKFYQPDNAFLTVAGKFKPEKALAYVNKYYGALKFPRRLLDKTYTEEPTQDGERTVTLRRAGKVGLVGVMYHIPAGVHPDYPAVEVLNEILTSEPSGRLYKALVETKKATSVNGGAYALHDPGMLEIVAQVAPKPVGSLKDVRDTLLNVLEVEAGRHKKATREEVDRARRKLLKERALLMTRSSQFAMHLTESIAQGDWRLFFVHRDRLAKVTPADVDRVAAAYLKRTNRTLGTFMPTVNPLPDRARIPSTPDAGELVKNYKSSETIAAGEAFTPTPANIEKRVRRSTLPSGVKTALLPKKTRGQAVTLTLSLRYGNEKSLNGRTNAAQFLGPLLVRGTKQHSRQEIQDELDKLEAQLETGGDGGQLTVTIVAKRNTLPAVLKLLREVLREPTFQPEEFDILKRQLRDELDKQSVDPMALASRWLQRHLSPYPKDDVRYVPTFEESIQRLQAVTRDQVVRLYKEQLGGESGELVVVGDFDPEVVTKEFTGMLGGWKATVPYRRIPNPARADFKGTRHRILTPDKESAMYLAGLKFALKDNDPDYPALRIGSFLFGEGSLSSRLANRVRKKEGLSYGVGSVLRADAKDKSARFLMYAICKPTNIGRVDKAAAEELTKFLKDGLGEAELAEAKKSYFEKFKSDLASDATVAGVLSDGLSVGRTMAYYDDFMAKVAALKPDDVVKAFRKYVDPRALAIVEAGDFKQAAAKAPEDKGKSGK